MKHKLLLSLGSSLLVFAPVMTVVACGDDNETVDAFTDYVNKIVLTTPQGAGTATIATLDAVVTRTATPVAITSQQVATDIKDELGLSAFTINSVSASYAITYQLLAKGTPTAGQVKTYTMTVSVKNTATNLTKMKTVDVKSSDLVPTTSTGTTQAQLDTYINGLVITNGPEHQNKTIAQLDTIVTSSASGTALDATVVFSSLNVDVDVRTKPSDVTLTYVLTKNNTDAQGEKQSFSLVITGRTSGGFEKAKAPHKVVSSENAPLTIQGIANSFTYTSLTPKSIADLDALVTSTANYSPFDGGVASNYFDGNNIVNLISTHSGVTWTYKVTKGTVATSGKQPYNFEIKASKTSPAESASKTIVYNSSDDVPAAFTQENLATYVNTTITHAMPADKTIATLSNHVATTATALTPSIATALGLTLNTTPNGVTLTYTLTKGAETIGSNVAFTLTVIGAHQGLTSVSKAAITITSSDVVVSADQAAVNADKALFVTAFGSSYSETTITTVPEVTSTSLADAVTPTFVPTNGSAVTYVLSNRAYSLGNSAGSETASVTVTATFTKNEATETHAFTVEYTTLKTAMLQLNMTISDINASLPSKVIDKNQTNEAAAASFTTIEDTLPNLTPNGSFNYVVTTSTNVAQSLGITIAVTHKTITHLTKSTNAFFAGFKEA